MGMGIYNAPGSVNRLLPQVAQVWKSARWPERVKNLLLTLTGLEDLTMVMSIAPLRTLLFP